MNVALMNSTLQAMQRATAAQTGNWSATNVRYRIWRGRGNSRDVRRLRLSSSSDPAHSNFSEKPLESVSLSSQAPAQEQVAAPAAAAPTPDVSEAAAPPNVAADEHGGVQSFPISSDMFEADELIQELTDKQQFGNRGEAWFFAQVALLVLILIPPLPLKGLVDLVGTLLITSGLVFMAYGLFSLGKVVSPLPQPRRNHKLVTSGMYSYVRHPMYGGLLMACLGLAAVTRNECRIALSLLLWWVLEQKVVFEEKALSELYPEYGQYKARVKKFFPYLY